MLDKKSVIGDAEMLHQLPIITSTHSNSFFVLDHERKLVPIRYNNNTI